MFSTLLLLTLMSGQAAPASAPGTDPDKVICKSDGKTGSRLAPSTKTCMTKAQWDEKQRLEQQGVKDQQSKSR